MCSYQVQKLQQDYRVTCHQNKCIAHFIPLVSSGSGLDLTLESTHHLNNFKPPPRQKKPPKREKYPTFPMKTL